MSTTFLPTFSDQPRYLYQAPASVAATTSDDADEGYRLYEELRYAVVDVLGHFPDARQALLDELDRRSGTPPFTLKEAGPHASSD